MERELLLLITQRNEIAEGTVLLEFSEAHGRSLPAFTAGSHLRLKLPNGLTRAYSLCNDPNESHRYQIAVRLTSDSRGGSLCVHKELQVGNQLGAIGPINQFPLDAHASKSILLAAGIGITPLLSMAHQLKRSGHAWHLHYIARTAGGMPFREDLTSGPLAGNTSLYIKSEAGGKLFSMKDAIGRPGDGSHLYVCGPASFMEQALEDAQKLGWQTAHVHSEKFHASVRAQRQSEAFKLVLVRSGITLNVPSDKTAAAVIREHGVDLPVSCEQGVCGTCITDVVQGRPDHRDQCLDDLMRTHCFTPCCSRSLDEALHIDL